MKQKSVITCSVRKMTSRTGIDNNHNFKGYCTFSCSRCNLFQSGSDICLFIKEYKERIRIQQKSEDERTPFISFADGGRNVENYEWINHVEKRFFENTPNKRLAEHYFLAEQGFINCMAYSPDGSLIIVGHNTGLIQAINKLMDECAAEILAEFSKTIINTYYNDAKPKDISTKDLWYPMFNLGTVDEENKDDWVEENRDKYLKGTSNEIVYHRWYFTESGYITVVEFSPNGSYAVVGHSTGLIQLRNGHTGVVLCTLRNIQFPPKPVYSLYYSRTEENVCYASSMDGAIYRIEIPRMYSSTEVPQCCITADPALEQLNLQFYGTPGISSHSTPFITQRSPALSMGLTADQSRMVVGYEDTSIKIYDMETQQEETTYKVHKLRLQFIPKKLRRMHFGQVCALRCHDQKPNIFASAAWDKTLRIWDVRCKVGCVMTFEGVDVCSDSIDLNRDHCLAGSWQPTEALGVWDLVARKRLNIIRVQNRRPDVDGEYIYACRYWRSSQFNRKGKYAIIGGSGTNCVEVINLHNRYITCSYPASGTVLAVASHEDRIAFGGTASVFTIATFHDPKHEKYASLDGEEYDVMKSVTLLNKDASDASAFSPTVIGAASTVAS